MLDESDTNARIKMLQYQRETIDYVEMSMDDMNTVLGNLQETVEYIKMKTADE
jgi:hypothetical protein